MAAVLACLLIVIISVTVVVLLHAPSPASATLLVESHSVVPGSPPTVRWPTEGEAAWSVPSLGVRDHSAVQSAVPIGSIAKLMTAIVVLRDHPLTPGRDGPVVTVTEADLASFRAEVAADQSNVTIQSGEMLSERQLVEGLLIHSGNDYADLIGRLDAASSTAFVAKMNATAAAMGLTRTSYADASGFDPSTVSTPAEQLIVAQAALRDPLIASLVDQTSVNLPVAGSVSTYTPLVGTGGVVGVKSGLTTQAGGCDVLARDLVIGGHIVQILTAVTGQHAADRLKAAGAEAFRLSTEVGAGIIPVPISGADAPLANLGWGSDIVPVIAKHPVVVPGWPGTVVTVSMRLRRHVTTSLPRGSTVGLVRVESGATTWHATVFTAASLTPPGLLDRVV